MQRSERFLSRATKRPSKETWSSREIVFGDRAGHYVIMEHAFISVAHCYPIPYVFYAHGFVSSEPNLLIRPNYQHMEQGNQGTVLLEFSGRESGPGVF